MPEPKLSEILDLLAKIREDQFIMRDAIVVLLKEAKSWKDEYTKIMRQFLNPDGTLKLW